MSKKVDVSVTPEHSSVVASGIRCFYGHLKGEWRFQATFPDRGGIDVTHAQLKSPYQPWQIHENLLLGIGFVLAKYGLKPESEAPPKTGGLSGAAQSTLDAVREAGGGLEHMQTVWEALDNSVRAELAEHPEWIELKNARSEAKDGIGQ